MGGHEIYSSNLRESGRSAQTQRIKGGSSRLVTMTSTGQGEMFLQSQRTRLLTYIRKRGQRRLCFRNLTRSLTICPQPMASWCFQRLIPLKQGRPRLKIRVRIHQRPKRLRMRISRGCTSQTRAIFKRCLEVWTRMASDWAPEMTRVKLSLAISEFTFSFLSWLRYYSIVFIR